MTDLLAVTTDFRPERGRDQRPRRLDTTHQLDDHVGVGGGDEVRRCIGHEVAAESVAAHLGEIADGHRLDGQRRTVGGASRPG